MEAWREELYANELWHHGIKGQQWGERNGPPYPLDKATHRAIVKSAIKEGNAAIKDEKKKILLKDVLPYALVSASTFLGSLALMPINPVAAGSLFVGSLLVDATWGTSAMSKVDRLYRQGHEVAVDKIIDSYKNYPANKAPSQYEAWLDVEKHSTGASVADIAAAQRRYGITT